MIRRLLAPILAAALLAGCSAADLQTAGTDLTAAQTAAQTAVNAWPVIKGILFVAETASPPLALPISAAIALIDPKVQQLQALLAAGSSDAATILQLAQTITQQAAQIQTAAAPAIKAVPSAP